MSQLRTNNRITLKRFFLTILISFLTYISTNSQTINTDYATNYLFSYITVDNGLPNNFVDNIYKDSKGFIWISTLGGGVLKYNGYDFVHFNNRSPFPLKSNFVRNVIEDDFNRLWIATERGIDIMDLSTNTKSNIQNDDDISGIFTTSTVKFLKDTQHCIWATTKKSILRFCFDSKGKIQKISKLKFNKPVQNSITAIYEFDGQIIAGINNEIFKLINDDQGNILPIPFSNTLILNCSTVKCLTDKENELWIGTDNGLYRFNPTTEKIKAYFHSDSDPMSLSQNLISDLKVNQSGQLIVATLKGINFYDSLIDGFQHVTCQSEKEANFKTINNDFVNTLLCDGRILWIGTEAGGLNKMIRPIISATNYQNNVNNSKTISNGPVNSIYIDNDENLWVGCIEGGLNLKKKDSDEFIHFTTANGLSHNSVSYISPIDDQTLLLGTWGGGLTIFDKEKKRGIFTLNPNKNNEIPFVGVAIKDTINNLFWIGSTTGIYTFDAKTKKLNKPLPDSVTSNVQGCLGALVNKKGFLYIGTTLGMFIIDLNTVKSGNIKFKLKSPQKTNSKTDFLGKLTTFLESSDGTIWLGTDGYGLVKIEDEDNDKYKFITTDNGLSNDIVCQLIEDNSQRIWIATCHGLCCYSPKSERIASYYKQEGLCHNQFFWNGCAKDGNVNKMYFGNMHGLIEIDNERYGTQQTYDKVYFTKLEVNDRIIYPGNDDYIETDISCAKDVYLHERDKSVTFEFSALNYNSPASIVYQYRLEGFNEKWTTVNHLHRMAIYTNLPSGNYKFQVRCATGSSDFSEISEIKIHVASYFYKQWWFIILVAACVLILINLLFRWRVEKLKSQKEILEEKVNQRTSALESKTEELSRQNELLFRQNEEISRQKNEMEKMTQKIQELTIDKLAFFTNITHEFRTPLTLIIGPIERALKLSTNPKVIEQLNFVNNNSKHLLSLVNQLMDFRKVESGNMPISLKPGNFLTFVEDILLPFKALANEHKVNIRYFNRLKNPYIMFDREAMTKILTNLISNALKFTPQNGHIDLYVATLNNPNRVYVGVSDDGCGIIKEDIEKVFNSFYQSKNQDEINTGYQSGTGIGLYVCKRLANLLGGDIFAKNNRKRGASFRLTTPLVNMETLESAPASNIIEGISVNEYDDSIDDQMPDDATHKMNILVVEDNLEMRKYIRSILSDTYSIVEASDGKNALQVLKNHFVDLILTDLMMPEMNGLQLAKNIKQDINISHIPIIILTAKTSRDSQLESFRNGVDDYITKPFDEAVLKAKIQTLIENRRKYQQKFINNMNIESLNISEDSSDKKFIDKALKIIKERYKDSEFEISDFSDSMGMSKTMLNKKMQALTKQSAGQFIRNYRLKIAHDLIIKNKITRNMNISEIAYEVGFNDPKYFTRCFTKHFGVTPSSIGEERPSAQN